MLVIGTLLILVLTAFIFLRETAKLMGVSVAQDDIAGSVLRFLVNIRYKLIYILKFGNPLYSLEVSRIYVYPLKSCSYIEAAEWEIDEFGFKHDRQYMIGYWDEKNQMYEPYSLRNGPRMSLVKIKYNLEENWFEFVYPIMDKDGNISGHSSFRLPCEISREFIDENSRNNGVFKTNLWDVHFQTHDIGKALPEEFKRSMKLTRPGTTLLVTAKAKKVKAGHPENALKEYRSTNFQDYYPMKFLAEEDIDLLNSKIKENGYDTQVQPLNFRPNLVVKGLPANHSIDDWYRFKIETKDFGSHDWNVAQKCPRCSIPNVKLDEGKLDTRLPVSKTLKSYRSIDAGATSNHFLGLYTIHHDHGYKIRVGDKVTLMEEKVQLYIGLTP
jgi:uncharacterized protein YcbX